MLLQAETLLQLNDAQLRARLEQVLVSELRNNDRLENVLEHWNRAVLFDLDHLMAAVEDVFDNNLEYFVNDPNSGKHLALLGFEVGSFQDSSLTFFYLNFIDKS